MPDHAREEAAWQRARVRLYGRRRGDAQPRVPDERTEAPPPREEPINPSLRQYEHGTTIETGPAGAASPVNPS